jgi:hypothetical protein
VLFASASRPSCCSVLPCLIAPFAPASDEVALDQFVGALANPALPETRAPDLYYAPAAVGFTSP